MIEYTTAIMINKLNKSRLEKEKELNYYQEELTELQEKMENLQMDIDATNTIIRMIKIVEPIMDSK
jgi:prefoldin subunit 5